MENEFYVAHQLGMTVARLRTEVSAHEYVQWVTYFARRGQEQELARMQGR